MKKRPFLSLLTLLLICMFISGIFSPLNAVGKITWRMTSVWSTGILSLEADKHFVKLVNELARGELEIKFFEGGKLVPPLKTFDAVVAGTVQAGADWPGYWAGKNTAFELLGSCPMGLTNIDYYMWYFQGGGAELYQEVYGKFGLVYFAHYATPMESGIRTHRPIHKIDDLKGLKIRMSGRIQGDLLRQVGAAPVSIAGGEIYQALEKGVIDAAEYSSPPVDYNLRLYEITEYWSVPGWHQPASMQGVMINKKAWDRLPEHLKTVIKVAAEATMFRLLSFFEVLSYDAVRKFEEKGTKIIRLDDASLERMQKMANESLLKYSKENPLYAKIAYSQFKFLERSARWREASSPFSYGRVPPLPDLDAIKACIK